MLKNLLAGAAALGALALAAPGARAQGAPFSAFSIQTLGGNCPSQGALVYQSSNGLTKCLAPGITAEVLSTNGAGADPSWVLASSVTPIATGTLVGNQSGSTQAPSALTAFSLNNAGTFTSAAAHTYVVSTLGGLNVQTQYSSQQGGLFATESLSAGILVPAGATQHGVNTAGFYLDDQSGGTQTGNGGTVALYTSALADAPNDNVFSFNPLCSIQPGATNSKCVIESDFNVSASGATVAGDQVVINGAGPEPNIAVGYSCRSDNVPTVTWGYCFFANDGMSQNGIYLGTIAPGGNSTQSAPINLVGQDFAGTQHTVKIYATKDGIAEITSGQTGFGVALADPGPTNLALFQPAGAVLYENTTLQTASGNSLFNIETSTGNEPILQLSINNVAKSVFAATSTDPLDIQDATNSFTNIIHVDSNHFTTIGESGQQTFSNTQFNPVSDNVQSLGGTTLRWNSLFVGSGGATISAQTGSGQLSINDVAGSQQSFISLMDMGTIKWQLRKRTDNSFVLTDSANSGTPIAITAGGASTFGEAATATVIQGSSIIGGPVYNNNGTYLGSAKIVQGSVGLSGGTGSITFAGNAIFTSSTSYSCAGNDLTAKNNFAITPTSGSAATVAGNASDVISFVCAGD